MTLNYHSPALGPSSRHKLRRTSPFASLLLDISSGLSSSDVSAIKLVLQVDKHFTRRALYQVSNAADLMSIVEGHGKISPTDTHFLENVLAKIGRKDLEGIIIKYHKKQAQCTAPKQVAESFTMLRPKILSPIPESQRQEEIKLGLMEANALLGRPCTEGSSLVDDTENIKPGTSSQSTDGLDSSQESLKLSQMSIEYYSSSQEKSSSQMSISDDEKMTFHVNDMCQS